MEWSSRSQPRSTVFHDVLRRQNSALEWLPAREFIHHDARGHGGVEAAHRAELRNRDRGSAPAQKGRTQPLALVTDHERSTVGKIETRQQRRRFGNLDGYRSGAVSTTPLKETLLILEVGETAELLEASGKTLRPLLEPPRLFANDQNLLAPEGYVRPHDHSGVLGTLELVDDGPKHGPLSGERPVRRRGSRVNGHVV